MNAIYSGIVVHQRFRPKSHRLRYTLAQMLFDLDAMPRVAGFSHNGPNVVSFHDRDHLDGSGTDLRIQVRQALHDAGLEDADAIHLLCMPRVLGHVFNPVSVFFCYRGDGSLMAMLYEVNNTFGERHSYLIPAGELIEGSIHQHCDKAFYVSPFMGMGMTYDFRVVPPAASVTVVVHGSDATGRVITASFIGRRAPVTAGSLLRMVLRHGILSFKVIGAIHWEALKLWGKGLRLQPRPAPPADAVSFVLPRAE
jgi:DUF1365 family protein